MLRTIISALRRQHAVRGGVTIGQRFHLGPRSVIWAPTALDIGHDVYVGKNVTIEVDGTIGDGVLIANNVGIIGRRDHDPFAVGTTIRRSPWIGELDNGPSGRVVIGADVWLGFGAIVLSGVSIGPTSVVGAGALVTKSVPPNSVVVGAPARVVGSRFRPEELREHWRLLTLRGVRVETGLAVGSANAQE